MTCSEEMHQVPTIQNFITFSCELKILSLYSRANLSQSGASNPKFYHFHFLCEAKILSLFSRVHQNSIKKFHLQIKNSIKLIFTRRTKFLTIFHLKPKILSPAKKDKKSEYKKTRIGVCSVSLVYSGNTIFYVASLFKFTERRCQHTDKSSASLNMNIFENSSTSESLNEKVEY